MRIHFLAPLIYACSEQWTVPHYTDRSCFTISIKKEVYLFHHHLINARLHPLPLQSPEAVKFCQNLIQAFNHTQYKMLEACFDSVVQ